LDAISRVEFRKFIFEVASKIFFNEWIISSEFIEETSQPLFLGTTISRKPPVSKAKTGVPQLIDSATVLGRLSIGAGCNRRSDA
jgi:hypothetical protein